jgi:hypothetical protein
LLNALADISSKRSRILHFESGKTADEKSGFRRPRDSPLLLSFAFLAERTDGHEIPDQTSLGREINNYSDVLTSVNSSVA